MFNFIRLLCTALVMLMAKVGMLVSLIVYAVCNFAIALPIDILGIAIGKDPGASEKMHQAFSRAIYDIAGTGTWLVSKLAPTK